MKLCLGTVQLGMEYGVAQDQKPNLEEAINILEFALLNGITTFDTANSYGNAEEIIGHFLKNHQQNRKQLHIITKTEPNCLENILPKNYARELIIKLSSSLKRLQTDYIDTYLFHTSTYAFNKEKLLGLYELKKSGLIKHCGVSVYHPEEAYAAIQSGFIDFIQLPFNLFDHRFYDFGIFSLAKEKNIIIHTRSVFLQGLFAMDISNIPPFLEIAKQPLSELENICKQNALNKLELALAFVKSFQEINKIVIGVNSLKQLHDNLQIYNNSISCELSEHILKQFSTLDKKIYLPTLWN